MKAFLFKFRDPASDPISVIDLLFFMKKQSHLNKFQRAGQWSGEWVSEPIYIAVKGSLIQSVIRLANSNVSASRFEGQNGQ